MTALIDMTRLVYVFTLLAFAMGALPSAIIAGTSPAVQDGRNSRGAIKIYVEIKAPDTISEAVKSQIFGQLRNNKNVSLLQFDEDDADHIFHFDIHEIRTRSDELTGYAIVAIWTWRKGIREIEETFGKNWDQLDHDTFARFASGLSLYGPGSEAFYICGKNELKQRLTSIVDKIGSYTAYLIPKSNVPSIGGPP
jgi:hypothetical protein